MRRCAAGARFRRQHAFGEYVVDFYCHEARLVIELDGGQHFGAREQRQDRRRTERLERAGVRVVLRFTNREVREQLDAVVATVLEALQRGRRA